jgi:hypothetical protein
MIDPPAQNGTIGFASGCDDRNFCYRDRDGGAMLANSLNHTFRLRGFGRRFGMIVVIRIGLAMMVRVVDVLKKMVNAMGLCRGDSQNEQRRECQCETARQPTASAERVHLSWYSILTGCDGSAQAEAF